MEWYDVDRWSPGPEPTGAAAPIVIEAEVHAGAARTRYLRSGAGPTLLLLHAAGERAEVWRPWMGRLASHFRVVAPDLPRAGGGRGAARSVGRAAAAASVTWLRDFLDGLGVESVRILARGQAGEVASRFAAEYPERVRDVLQVAAGVGPPAIALSSAAPPAP